MKQRDPGACAIAAVMLERMAQDRKWGEQNHDDLGWLPILTEEVGEVAQALLRQKDTDASDLKHELTQVAAVAVAWVECIMRREAAVADSRRRLALKRSRESGGARALREAYERGMMTRVFGDDALLGLRQPHAAQKSSRSSDLLSRWVGSCRRPDADDDAVDPAG